MPKSEILVITKNTPDMLAWHINGVDDKGNAYTEGWSGKPDGTSHPMTGTAGKGGKASFKRESDNVMVIHEDMPQAGGSMDSRAVISDDRKSMTEDATMKGNDGKESKMKFVWQRVERTAKSGATKKSKSAATTS
ncbi:MAG: hypothetical protein NVS9B15_01160 [Acidobacteriaceae bacterium]